MTPDRVPGRAPHWGRAAPRRSRAAWASSRAFSSFPARTKDAPRGAPSRARAGVIAYGLEPLDRLLEELCRLGDAAELGEGARQLQLKPGAGSVAGRSERKSALELGYRGRHIEVECPLTGEREEPQRGRLELAACLRAAPRRR